MPSRKRKSRAQVKPEGVTVTGDQLIGIREHIPLPKRMRTRRWSPEPVKFGLVSVTSWVPQAGVPARLLAVREKKLLKLQAQRMQQQQKRASSKYSRRTRRSAGGTSDAGHGNVSTGTAASLPQLPSAVASSAWMGQQLEQAEAAALAQRSHARALAATKGAIPLAAHPSDSGQPVAPPQLQSSTTRASAEHGHASSQSPAVENSVISISPAGASSYVAAPNVATASDGSPHAALIGGSSSLTNPHHQPIIAAEGREPGSYSGQSDNTPG